MQVRWATPQGSVRIRDGRLEGLRLGSYDVVATAIQGEARPSVRLPVKVRWPPLTRLAVSPPDRTYAQTTVSFTVRGFHADGSERTELAVDWSVSGHQGATIDRTRMMPVMSPGSIRVTPPQRV